MFTKIGENFGENSIENECGLLPHSKGETWSLFWKSPSISIHIGPAVSFALGWVGDVPGIVENGETESQES